MTTIEPPDFDAVYAIDPDPWKVASSWYERRKLAALLAALPAERYDSAWEPGCGIGVATAALAERARHLVASDASPVAVRRTQARTARLPNVDVVVSRLPEVPIDGPVDLIVVAEFLYYLGDVSDALEALWSATRDGTHLAVQHWAHAPHDAHVSGPEVHRLIADYAASRGAAHLVAHEDQDFLLDVYEVAT
jgi:trans-aconitate methyltransferase